MIPDLPFGITIVSVVGTLATFITITILGWKFISFLAARPWRKGTEPQEVGELKKENKILKDRVENLETLVCRLDQEINSQFEKSLWISRSLTPNSTSQQMTAHVNIASALESRYQVLQEIGRGGMGIVFHAYDKQLKENVAIKVLSPFLSNDAESLERLRREVTAARKITHGNVIKIYDIGESAGLHYITMEYFAGENLRQIISRRGPLPIQEGLQMIYQICDGLHAAHSQGIIHRDLKSHNVILNEKGHLKIIDLGLARTNQLEGMTATGLILGTPEYMSPEQVSGRRIDERSDLYALGVIMYEIFSGRLPFSGESAIAIGFKHLKEELKPLKAIQLNVPDKLSSIVDRLMEKDPSHRYQTVVELRRDLEELHQYIPSKLDTVPTTEKAFEVQGS